MFEHQILTELTKMKRKKKLTDYSSYIITLAVLHGTCLQCNYTEMCYNYFTFHK